MFKNNYVLSLLAKGNVLEEDDSRRITLPFGEEFKVRLINKNYHRCAADLSVNGEHIARFILNAGETSDIERYLDGNMQNGSRFKFVSLNDSQVKDKKDIDNGIIEVHYYKELVKNEPIIREVHHHHHHDKYPLNPYPKPYWVYSSNDLSNDISFGGSISCKGMSAEASPNMMFNSCLCSSTGAEGAAVRGSESSQKFQTVSGYEFESIATILKLKIVNGEHVIAQERYCSGCGRKNRDGDRYCPSCGKNLK